MEMKQYEVEWDEDCGTKLAGWGLWGEAQDEAWDETRGTKHVGRRCAGRGLLDDVKWDEAWDDVARDEACWTTLRGTKPGMTLRGTKLVGRN